MEGNIKSPDVVIEAQYRGCGINLNSGKDNTNIIEKQEKSKKNNDPHFQRQMIKVFNAFKEHPKTMLMVSVETGILRANICRYVAEWQDYGKIQLIEKRFCTISKHMAGYYTTNPELFKDC